MVETISEKMVNVFKFTDKIVDGKTVTAKSNAGNMLMTMTLLMGGTILLWPMKWLQDHKAGLSEKVNHMLDHWRGDKMTAEEVKARDDEVEKAIACEPKQTWPTMIFGRILAVSSTMFFGQLIMGPQRNNKVKDFAENLMTGSVHAKPSIWHHYARLTV